MIEFFRIVGCRFDDLAVFEFEMDIFEGEALVNGGCIVSDRTI